jgi:hypothetical protein
MDTDERIARLEEKAAEYDRIIAWARAYARLTAKGRLLLKALGLS